MLDKLIGPNGALWRTGNEETTPPQQPLPQGVVQAAYVTGVAPQGAESIDQEVLASTRTATFEIPGSVYVRFMAESKKLEHIIADPTTRIKTVVTVLGISPADLVTALSTMHRAALESWKATVANAKTAGHAEKIGKREQQLANLATENDRIRGNIERLQTTLSENTGKATVLRQEIQSAQAEVDQQAKHYDAAIAATESELGQVIATFQSIK